ncbi:hypothetical protein DERP_002767 [Dermatophagoides pteronyssinus]|uniref:Uncharacterized protein n=1 Tax=Dermatophagoides pteronyssinus TaxID=6956 RepID=A0ABQ8JVN2_DERPT|nr:hypothetical protein DERP_002767 [Dermatophagoides pteronyssinus]
MKTFTSVVRFPIFDNNGIRYFPLSTRSRNSFKLAPSNGSEPLTTTSFPVGKCFANLTLAKLPLPIVLSKR